VVLRWLCEQPEERVTLLLGNHDACRVVELVGLDDDRFAEARALAGEIARAEAEDESPPGAAAARRRGRAAGLRDAFAGRFPDIPTPELALRDFASYSTEQRDLVRELLLAGRFRLAVAARLARWPDVPVLATHGALTLREIALLGFAEDASPAALASALNALLARAVEKVRDAWRSGESAALDLAPLHVAGVAGREGGGLLYHRPADPDDASADAAWRFDSQRPRRFDPRSLPRGLVQVCGHTSHEKCVAELARWVVADRRDEQPRVRLLSVRGEDVRYARWAGERPPDDAASASLFMVDGAMHRTPPEAVPLLDLLRPTS